MKKAILIRVVLVFVAMIALSCLPQSALAQRGGHGGGGGFHGGGGGGGFHGGGGGGGFHGGGAAIRGGGGFSGGGRSGFAAGRNFGGFRGGNFGGRGFLGGRGGLGRGGRPFGFGGRFGGRGFGNGWRWGFGFGWPYWGWDYPYGYGYSPWYYAPDPYYSYPNYGPADYPPAYPDNGNGYDNPPPADPRAPRPRPNPNGPAPEGGANADYPNSDVAAVAPRGPVVSIDRMSVPPGGYRTAGVIPAHFTRERATIERAAADTPLRPEMQKALARLREMPPFAREREIETGRYRQFSSEEKQILRNAE